MKTLIKKDDGKGGFLAIIIILIVFFIFTLGIRIGSNFNDNCHRLVNHLNYEFISKGSGKYVPAENDSIMVVKFKKYPTVANSSTYIYEIWKKK